MKHLRKLEPIPTIILLFIQPIFGQVKERIIPFPEWPTSYDKEGIVLELIEIEVAGKPIMLGQRFDADENWMRHMTLRIKNISNKAIVAFGVGGGLLEGINKELQSYESFQYGIGWNWGQRFDPEKETTKGTILKPGEVIELNYTNVNQLTRKVLAKVGEGTFCKLKFMAPAIQYADGEVDSSPGMKFHGERKQ